MASREAMHVFIIIVYLAALPVGAGVSDAIRGWKRKPFKPKPQLRIAFLRDGKLIRGGQTDMIQNTSERFQLIVIGKSGKPLVPQPTLSKVQIGGDPTLGNIVASATDPSIFDVVSTAGVGNDAISVSLVATEGGTDYPLTASLSVEIDADAPAGLQLNDLGATPAS